MSRLASTFAALRADNRPGLVTYVTAGDPDLDRSRKILTALGAAGADVIEVGVPYSDPVADGPAIQRASERALAAGGSLTATLDLMEATKDVQTPPRVLFTYVNPVFRMGVKPFADRAADVGVDGVLLLDLPIEEAETVHPTFAQAGIDQIFLVSPTTSDARLFEAGRLGRGFLYAISRLGVTGVRSEVAGTAAPLVARVRAVTSLPVALGFGVSRPEHVAQIGRFADAAVVGSALVEVIRTADEDGEDVEQAVRAFVRWLKVGDA